MCVCSLWRHFHVNANAFTVQIQCVCRLWFVQWLYNKFNRCIREIVKKKTGTPQRKYCLKTFRRRVRSNLDISYNKQVYAVHSNIRSPRCDTQRSRGKSEVYSLSPDVQPNSAGIKIYYYSYRECLVARRTRGKKNAISNATILNIIYVNYYRRKSL